MRRNIIYLIPFFIGFTLSAVLSAIDWMGFWFIFAPIGASISLGSYITSRKELKDKDFGRRISITLVALIILIFLGFMQRENLEETVFYFALLVQGLLAEY